MTARSSKLRPMITAFVVAAGLALGLGAVLTAEEPACQPARLALRTRVGEGTPERAAAVALSARMTAPTVDDELDPPTASPPSDAPWPESPMVGEADGTTTDDVTSDAPLEATADDPRARAARLLADLVAETDPLAALVLGEELAPLARELDRTGRKTLLALARDGDAPRAAALTALGRLEPTAGTVDLVRDAVLSRPSPEARAAGVDALALLAERGAPGEQVEAAMLLLADATF